MTHAVIDTGVPKMATRSGDDYPECQLACINYLESIMDDGIVAIDSNFMIVSEYLRRLSKSGQPTVGDRFLKWVLTQLGNPTRINQVDIEPLGDTDTDGFKSLPTTLGAIDPADMKFVCAFLCSEATELAVSADTDWLISEATLRSESVNLRFLCREMLELQLGGKRKTRERAVE